MCILFFLCVRIIFSVIKSNVLFMYICIITVFVRMRLCVFIDEALLQIFHLKMVTRVRPPARTHIHTTKMMRMMRTVQNNENIE